MMDAYRIMTFPPDDWGAVHPLPQRVSLGTGKAPGSSQRRLLMRDTAPDRATFDAISFCGLS
jgi:hypothetical protein